MDKSRQNYYTQHLTFKKSAMIIPKNKLQKGMVIQNRYRNLEDKTKDYIFLVLQPLWLEKVHVLSLNEFSNIRFNDLAKETGLKVIPKFRKLGLDIPKLIMRKSAQRFYYGRLAKDMERYYNNGYRTLFLRRMGLVQLIDYDFDKDVMDLSDLDTSF